MPKIFCVYHPQSDAVGFCEKCGLPICATCSRISTGYLTRMARRLCNFCAAKAEARTMAIIIGTFLPFILLASFTWAFLIVSPILGVMYIIAVPAISALLAVRYYRKKIREIKAPEA